MALPGSTTQLTLTERIAWCQSLWESAETEDRALAYWWEWLGLKSARGDETIKPRTDAERGWFARGVVDGRSLRTLGR